MASAFAKSLAANAISTLHAFSRSSSSLEVIFHFLIGSRSGGRDGEVGVAQFAQRVLAGGQGTDTADPERLQAMTDTEPGAGHDDDVADLGVAEIRVHAFPEPIVAVHAVDGVRKAVDEFEQQPLTRAEARPVEVERLGVGVEVFLDRFAGKARPVAPHAHAVAN